MNLTNKIAEADKENFDRYYQNKMAIMRKLASHFFKTLEAINAGNTIIKGLEIGVNTGDCSTKIWLEEIPDNSEFWLVDMWKPYSSNEEISQRPLFYQEFDASLERNFLSTFLEVRKMELKRPSLDINILRGSSKKTLSNIQENTFDFIYIDGDHKYEAVLADLLLSKKLINKRYGLICGDDLDVAATPERYQRAKLHPNQDLIQEGSFSYHPGVLAAAHEVFPHANMLNSFWWIYCYDGEFKGTW